MRLHIISDLHFEFQKWPMRIDVNTIDADVTILAGDIGIGLQGIQWALDHFRRPVIRGGPAQLDRISVFLSGISTGF